MLHYLMFNFQVQFNSAAFHEIDDSLFLETFFFLLDLQDTALLVDFQPPCSLLSFFLGIFLYFLPTHIEVPMSQPVFLLTPSIFLHSVISPSPHS